MDVVERLEIMRSKRDAATTKKSNRFQFYEKYARPYPINLRTHSMKKIAVKT
jgi:hypothetical protein